MITSRRIIDECNGTLSEGEGAEVAKKVGKAVARGTGKALVATAKGLYKAGKWALGYINWEKANAMEIAQYALKNKKNDMNDAIRYLKRVLSNQDDPKIEKEITKAIGILRSHQEQEEITAAGAALQHG